MTICQIKLDKQVMKKQRPTDRNYNALVKARSKGSTELDNSDLVGNVIGIVRALDPEAAKLLKEHFSLVRKST